MGDTHLRQRRQTTKLDLIKVVHDLFPEEKQSHPIPLQKQITQLINGETVETLIFDFVSGFRSDKTKTMHVGSSEILVIEGIHALNPRKCLWKNCR